jgi:hypothetical protein
MSEYRHAAIPIEQSPWRKRAALPYAQILAGTVLSRSPLLPSFYYPF